MSTARIVAGIAAAQAVVVAIVGPLLDFVDQRAIVRRTMVLVVLWMLVDVYLWAKGYAGRAGVSGLELAAVISAMTVPVTVLQAFLFRSYDVGRRADNSTATTTTLPAATVDQAVKP